MLLSRATADNFLSQLEEKTTIAANWLLDNDEASNASSFSIIRNTVASVGLTLCLLLAIKYYRYQLRMSQKMNIPGPKAYPFIGILPHLIKHFGEDWPRETVRQSKTHGKIWGGILPGVGVLPVANLFTTDEGNVRHFLQDNFGNYASLTIQRILPEVLGRGIFASNGDGWKMHRKVISNMFTRNLLRSATNFTAAKLFDVIRLFQERIAEKMAKEGNNQSFIDVDIQDVFYCLTFDITCQIAFGIDYNSIGNEKQHEFPRAFDEIVTLSQERIVDALFEIKKYFRVGRREKRIYELDRLIYDFYSKIVKERAQKTDQTGFDLLSKYLDFARTSNVEVSEKDLKDVTMNILLAGRDTTACALSWTWFELTRNPEVVQKIIEEVQSICGTGEEADYTFDTINKLRYTHCVALEVLRLHPSVPIDSRVALSDDRLPDGTFIPAGGEIEAATLAMGRSKHIWGHDADLFRPERFMGEKEPSSYKYPVFWGGPRSCLGKPLALMEMKLTMGILLTSDLNFEDNIGHPGDISWSLTMSMKNGFPIHISRR